MKEEVKKVTILTLQEMKDEREKITMLTAYDFPFARIVDRCGVDIILVGDSVGTVVQGVPNTLPVTMEDMIYHTKMVNRARGRALLVFDMPFMSYQESLEQARHNAGRAIKESGAEAVKLEGGANMARTIEAITDIDIPVMAHIGLTPQSIHRMGGYRIQGRAQAQRRKLLADAKAVETAGAFSVVLEGIPAELAKEITGSLRIPTIGIGAGINCDGQVLVLHDLLGVYAERKLTFVKQYANLREIADRAVSQYLDEVKKKKFPGPEHSFSYGEKPPRRGPGKGKKKIQRQRTRKKGKSKT
jgi:3-methyl-2-oxobutanoate hydroxymethyltransferase